MTKCYLSITITLVVVTIVTSRQLKCQSLQWAPSFRRKVFTAIINNLHCPTWSTRNSFTKDPTTYTKLRLPEGQPFAFYCGACFTPWSIKANLTAEMYPKVPLILKPIPKKNHNGVDKFQHDKNDFTICLVSYGLTKPLAKGGSLTCRLNRGTRVYEEKISFSVIKANIEAGKEEEIDFPSNGVVRLKCPEKKGIVIPMYVWQTTDTPKEDVPFISSTLDHQIVYKPTKKEESVSCSMYDLTNPSTVHITRYKLFLKEDQDIKPGKWVVAEDPKDEANNTQSSKGILIVVGIILAVICVASVLGVASFGVCKLKKKRRNVPGKSTSESNRHSLLSSSPMSSYDAKRLQNIYNHRQ